MDFGMPTLVENRSLIENIRLCAELGLQFLELNMNFPEYQIPCLERTDELNSLAREFGIYYTLHLDENLNVADFNPQVAKAYSETVRCAIRIAGKLDIPVMNMHMHHGVYITLPDKKVWMYDRNREEYLNSYRQFQCMCENEIGSSNLRICVENTDGFTAFEKEALNAMLLSPLFALTWDIGHSIGFSGKDSDYILAQSEHLCHMHIHDALQNGKHHLALGDGVLPLEDFLELAKDHDCRCVLETKTVEALKESVHWLRERKWME